MWRSLKMHRASTANRLRIEFEIGSGDVGISIWPRSQLNPTISFVGNKTGGWPPPPPRRPASRGSPEGFLKLCLGSPRASLRFFGGLGFLGFAKVCRGPFVGLLDVKTGAMRISFCFCANPLAFRGFLELLGAFWGLLGVACGS